MSNANWPWGRVAGDTPRFWMVFKDDACRMTATHRHKTREAAVEEAQRLAQRCTGDRFYVAAFTGYAQITPVGWFEMGKEDCKG